MLYPAPACCHEKGALPRIGQWNKMNKRPGTETKPCMSDDKAKLVLSHAWVMTRPKVVLMFSMVGSKALTDGAPALARGCSWRCQRSCSTVTCSPHHPHWSARPTRGSPSRQQHKIGYGGGCNKACVCLFCALYGWLERVRYAFSVFWWLVCVM